MERVTEERASTPVLRNVAQQAVLDLVASGGAGRWTCSVNLVWSANFCSSSFYNRTRAAGAAAIGRDRQFAHKRIAPLPQLESERLRRAARANLRTVLGLTSI